jgi:ribosomal protein S3AE
MGLNEKGSLSCQFGGRERGNIDGFEKRLRWDGMACEIRRVAFTNRKIAGAQGRKSRGTVRAVLHHMSLTAGFLARFPGC